MEINFSTVGRDDLGAPSAKLPASGGPSRPALQMRRDVLNIDFSFHFSVSFSFK